MPTQGETTLSTFLFCRSSIDGTIAPVWNDACETQLRGEFEIGLTVGGRYLLQQPLGQGSMGRVFLAKDLRLDRPVAMKVVSHGDYSTEFLESVLEREAKLGAGLQHQGIAAVYDFGYQNTKSYTVFEYVAGESLRRLLQRRCRLPLTLALGRLERSAAARVVSLGAGYAGTEPTTIRNTPILNHREAGNEWVEAVTVCPSLTIHGPVDPISLFLPRLHGRSVRPHTLINKGCADRP